VANTKHCTLSTLSEGCIGKLQLLKSGRVRLVLGSTVLHVAMGTQVGFREVRTEVTCKESDYILMVFCPPRMSLLIKSIYTQTPTLLFHNEGEKKSGLSIYSVFCHETPWL
jgi:hypothetical protein